MNVQEWQDRLFKTFGTNNFIGHHLKPILAQEDEHPHWIIAKYRGHLVLVESFLDFYLETMAAVIKWLHKNGWPKSADSYGLLVAYFAATFKRFRSAETLFLRGYPFDGYALLRDLKDRAVLLAGVVHGITTLNRLLTHDGVDVSTRAGKKRSKDRKMREENRVTHRILAKQSGLTESDQEMLEDWQDLFNDEVHGGKLAFFTECVPWLKGTGPLHLGPAKNERAAAMYMNRMTEIAWLYVRMLPYLRPTADALGAEWSVKHGVLDDSFRIAVRSLGDLGKPIAGAFTRMVDKRFKFKAKLHYMESSGTA